MTQMQITPFYIFISIDCFKQCKNDYFYLLSNSKYMIEVQFYHQKKTETSTLIFQLGYTAIYFGPNISSGRTH